MSHPLQQRIRDLQGRIVRLLAIRGLSLMLATVLATVITLGGLDYWLRFQDRGVLVVFTVAVLAVFGWTCYLAVRSFLNAHLRDADVALQVEACFPEVKDRLASAVEFLRQPEDDPLAGSAAMRRMAISQAATGSENLDFAVALDRRPAMRAALAALVVGGMAVCLIVTDASAARTALARLSFPLGSADWPQRTHLALRQPIQTVVRGQTLEVAVIDARHAPLPLDCRIHYRLKDAEGRTREESEPMQLVGNVAVARRENVGSSLEFRCTGGDDQSSPWNAVQVVDSPEPPSVGSLMLKITPPSYTNWPEEDRDVASPRPLLAGSRVLLTGKATKRLQPASNLRIDDGRTFPLAIDADGLTFHVGNRQEPGEIIVSAATGYSVHLVDVEGVEGGDNQRWQFRVLTDSPPVAIIERPAGDLFVTDKAVVGFRISAHDDLALREVKLVLRPSNGNGKETSLTLFRGTKDPPPSSLSVFDSGAAGEQETFDRILPLSEFHLAPGMQLTSYATANDYHGQAGRSDPRILTIITPEQLLERMAVRQSQVVAELARVLQLQREAASQVQSSSIRLQEAGLEQSDIELLQNAEFNQREVARSLTSSADGLPLLIRGLLSDVETNRIDSPDFERRMQGLLAELDRLGSEQLPPLSVELTAAIKGSLIRLQSFPRPAGRDTASEAHLALAGEHQRQVVASLEGMLAGLRQWEDYRRFHGEVAQLLRDQEIVARSTTELGAQTVGRDVKELSPQESADLKILAERQLELARRETRLEQEMEQTVAALGQGEPLAAGTLTDAVAEARRLAIAADMSAAGGKIRENDLGLAPADQQRILENLQEVLDILTNNRRQELGRLARKLGEAEKDLAAIHADQKRLRSKLEQSEVKSGGNDAARDRQKSELKKLADEESDLSKKTQPFGHRLERLTAEEAAAVTELAVQGMEQGSRAADQGDRPAALAGAKRAEAALADTARKLREKRIEVEAELAMKEQERLHDTLQSLAAKEQQIAEQTRELAELEQRGRLDRTQIDRLLRLAHQQELLRDETSRVMQSLDSANIFRTGLSLPVEEMGRASALLQRRQTGAATQEAEKSAIDRLKLLLTAAEPEVQRDPKKPDGTQEFAVSNRVGDKQDGPPPNGVLPLAQLKLLKLLQEDLNLRTQQLNQAEGGKSNEEFRERHARLAEEQIHLAELAFQLLRPSSPGAGEKRPDAIQPKEKLP